MMRFALWLLFAFFVGLPESGVGAAESVGSRREKCEAGVRYYLAYEKKGWELVESSAPLGAVACRNAVGDVEQTTIVLTAECGSFVFENFQSPLKSGLQKVKGVMPSDTVLDVISKARLRYLKSIKSFCGMEPPPAGVSQDAADCSWFIDIQLKYFTKLNSVLASLAAKSPMSCVQRFEAIKSNRIAVPEACRRYTMETFPGEDVKSRMVEKWSDSGRFPNPAENVADSFLKLRLNALSQLRRQCDPRGP
ncbi:MAG: hypothetical protein KGP28_06245 [Bdellovibrionales bacterium]|nr:hypothetical protein [Bdellovibrionales bacterium]